MSNKAVIFYDPLQVEAVLLVGERLNLPMFHKDLRIFRGVDNTITFNLKDSDRQPVKILGQSIRAVIVNPYNQELMLTKFLYNKDEQNGIYELRLTPGDVQQWSAGFYQYSLTLIDGDTGAETLFYTTLDQDVTGRLELIDKPFPEFVPSKLIKKDDWTLVNYNNVTQPFTVTYITSRFPGDANKDYKDALQTFSVLLKNFTGTLYLQASLEENPGTTDDGWFNVSVDPVSNADFLSYTQATGINVYNFVGNYVWLRFKYIVGVNPIQFEPYEQDEYDRYSWECRFGEILKIWLKI
jgi:hypothetical protein